MQCWESTNVLNLMKQLFQKTLRKGSDAEALCERTGWENGAFYLFFIFFSQQIETALLEQKEVPNFLWDEG